MSDKSLCSLQVLGGRDKVSFCPLPQGPSCLVYILSTGRSLYVNCCDMFASQDVDQSLQSSTLRTYSSWRWDCKFFFFFFFFFFFLSLDIDFLFLFLRDADSRKGAVCLFCVRIHKKKKKKRSSSGSPLPYGASVRDVWDSTVGADV